MFDSVRYVFLGWWGRFVCDHPIAILVGALLLAAGSVWLTVERLGFEADRNLLVSPDLEWNARFIDYARRFHGHDALIVTVDVAASEGGAEAARRFADDLAGRLEADTDHVARAWHRFDPPPELLRLAPMEQFREGLGRIGESRPLLGSRNVGELVERVTGELTRMRAGVAREGELQIENWKLQSANLAEPPAAVRRAAQAPEDHGPDADAAGEAVERIERLGELLEAVRLGVAGDLAEAERSGLIEEADPRYFESADRSLLFVHVDPVPAEGLHPYDEAVAAVRGALAAARAEAPGIAAGLTGLPVMQADESELLTRDSALASLVAVAAIAVLMIAAFVGVRLPMMMVLTLAVGVAWSFGFLTLAIGHLQLLSVFFTVILLGLGVDFGIHVVSAFEKSRPLHGEGRAGCRAAIVEVMHAAGPGILGGALTTAIAFSTTLLTNFRGMAEMGLIAAVGVLLCMVAMLSVLPAMLILFFSRERHVSERRGASYLHTQPWVSPMMRWPGWAIAAALAVALAAGFGALRVRYDNNLMELYPDGLESVEWQQRVLDRSSEAVWSAASVTRDLGEARERARAFAERPTVRSVGGVGLLFPPDEEQKLELIRAARDELGAALDPGLAEAGQPEPDTPESLRRRLSALSVGMSVALNRPEVRDRPAIREAVGALLATVQETLGLMGSAAFIEEGEARVAALYRWFLGLRAEARQRVDRALTTRELTPADLPEFVQRRSISANGPTEYALEVFPAEDVWEDVHMAPFMRDLRAVDPEVTGVPVQIYESGRLITRSYGLAALYASVAVLALVWMDFRRLSDALLCMVPVAWGFVTMFAATWLAGLSINPANIMVLPLMFGIGVAAGVHIMHRYRQLPHVPPLGLAGGTGKGILLTSTTTVIAFSALLLASHRGIRSLGFVLAVGVAMTFIACVTLMPAILEVRNRLADRE